MSCLFLYPSLHYLELKVPAWISSLKENKRFDATWRPAVLTDMGLFQGIGADILQGRITAAALWFRIKM